MGRSGRHLLISMILVLSFALSGLLSGCDQVIPADEKEYTIEVTDQLGRVVKLEKVPQRIISLAPSNTEIIFALGLEDRLVAVTDYCDYPPEAKDKPSIGGFSTPNIEEVISLSPDLILATSRHENKIIPHLEERGMTVFALNPKTMDEVMAAITLAGQVTGKEERALELVTDMQRRIKAMTDMTNGLPSEQRPKVCYLVWHDPPMSAGSGTLQGELIEKAGGTNIAQELTDYADLSLEEVIAADPQVMIAGVGHGSDETLTLQFFRTEPRLRDTEARLKGQIYGVDGNIVSRPGPRIVDGLEAIARFIHPEIFE
jgi:iron complex transport system substrate-binding protein